MARIDGKYEIINQRENGAITLYTVNTVLAPGKDAEQLRLSSFAVSTPAERSAFHRYRASLRAIAPAGLRDIVARPGAYYAVWQPLEGEPLSNLTAPSPETAAALHALAEKLAAQGYTLQDAEIVLQRGAPQVAYLSPASHSPQEARVLNAAALSAWPLPARAQPRRPRLRVWSWLPGLALLIAAGYVSQQAIQIYLNPPIADVPSVIGTSGVKAAKQLTQAGFRVQYAEGDNRQAALGSVINQEPSGGSNLHLGRLVTLTVNNPPALKTPRLENLTVDQAKAVLSDNMLKLSSVSQVDGALTGVPQGRVVAQLPPPDSTIRRGQAVRLLVSSGVSAPQTWLPELRGLSFDQASALVRRAGLVVHTIVREDSAQPEGIVLRQNPAAYARVDAGSPVTLVVARTAYQSPAQAVTPLPVPPPPAPPPVEIVDPNAPTPQPSGAPGTVPMSYTFPSDLGSGQVEIVVKDDDGERVILPPTDAAKLAGATAQRSDVQVRGNYTFIVRLNGRDIATFGAQP